MTNSYPEQKVEVAGDSELVEELSVSSEER